MGFGRNEYLAGCTLCDMALEKKWLRKKLNESTSAIKMHYSVGYLCSNWTSIE